MFSPFLSLSLMLSLVLWVDGSWMKGRKRTLKALSNLIKLLKRGYCFRIRIKNLLLAFIEWNELSGEKNWNFFFNFWNCFRENNFSWLFISLKLPTIEFNPMWRRSIRYKSKKFSTKRKTFPSPPACVCVCFISIRFYIDDGNKELLHIKHSRNFVLIWP